MSKNKFEIEENKVIISHPNWNFLAFVSIKDDYADEIQSVTWSE